MTSCRTGFRSLGKARKRAGSTGFRWKRLTRKSRQPAKPVTTPGYSQVHDRVVLDTNVLVSALLQPLGPSAHLLLLALNGSIRLCMTGSIYAEYEEVISRPRFQ